MPRTRTSTQRLLRILTRPMIQWRPALEAMSEESRYQLDLDATHVAELAARLAAYTAALRQAGHRGRRRKIEPPVHIHAVKAQNAAGRKVRKALGYTYTRLDFHF